ncbi:dTDP-4-dehydrorhamnose 3,5-epimerase [Lacihabitans lacunae]|jgi:dTDP-4-dehydrorhamnose 3,5-epimerase|uniref:dTDP-4-dehydrorhamnose 3,5-epimerase n=1 Tax=Lacihabitans lacunae TaxID=1028214 RepID=A0ABV7Z1T8_9BACT
MEFKKTSIEGLLEISPRIFRDDRGYFFESYSETLFKANGVKETFVQDNQSFSTKGVLRGLHFQKAPFAQGKLVRVIKGSVLDVAVDLRPNSPTFGKHETFLLTAENQKMVYVPEGFAHGFYTIEEAIFSYKCTNLYDKASEGGIIWNDPTLNIDWNATEPLVSEKDMELPTFEELKKTLV